MDEQTKRVPATLRPRFGEIVAITDRFCREHLDEEYAELCREMAVVVCREGLPVTKGTPIGWAAGVVYSVAWVNFLSDPTQPNHMRTEDLAKGVGVSPATMMSRAKDIREGLDLIRMDPRWCTRAILETNPLVWLVEVGGLIVDLRTMPRAVQEDALRRGIIPFLPDAQSK